MRISVYKNISKIASRIRSEVLSRYCPGDRIPSEIEIAEQLKESQNRIHRALVMLIQEGIIYSSGVTANCLLKGIAVRFLLCHKNPPVIVIKAAS